MRVERVGRDDDPLGFNSRMADTGGAETDIMTEDLDAGDGVGGGDARVELEAAFEDRLGEGGVD
jgi:hypothetical protein